MKEPMAKREKNEALTFKTIVLQVRKNGTEKTSTLLLDDDLSASQTLMHVLLYYQQKISDLGWQVSLVMLIGSEAPRSSGPVTALAEFSSVAMHAIHLALTSLPTNEESV